MCAVSVVPRFGQAGVAARFVPGQVSAGPAPSATGCVVGQTAVANAAGSNGGLAGKGELVAPAAH